jgi:hypothetical protein
MGTCGNGADFIQEGADALGIGGELVSAATLQSGQLDAIPEAARLYVTIVREARRGATVLITGLKADSRRAIRQ